MSAYVYIYNICVHVHSLKYQPGLFVSLPLRCSVLQCVAVCCSVLQCVAVCCSVLQCVAVCCSGIDLRCVPACKNWMRHLPRMSAHVYIYIYKHTYISYIHVSTHMYIYIYIYIYVHTHTYIYICMFTCVYICTHALKQWHIDFVVCTLPSRAFESFNAAFYMYSRLTLEFSKAVTRLVTSAPPSV